MVRRERARRSRQARGNPLLPGLRLPAKLLDALRSAVVATDLDGTIVYWSRSAETLYGWPSDEVVGKHVTEAIVVQGPRRRVEDVMACLEAGRSWSGEVLARRRDGTTFTALVTESPIHDDRGALAGILGVSADVGERTRADEESDQQRQAAERLAEVGRLLSQSLDPAVVARRIVESVHALFRAQACILSRLVAGTLDLEVLAYCGDVAPWPGPRPIIPNGGGMSGLAVRERSPVVTPDLLEDARVSFTPEDRARVARASSRAVLAVPLVAKQTVIGALAIGDRAGRVFSEREIRLGQTFADQAAVALENARLFEEQTRLLDETARQRQEAVALEAVARQLTSSLDRAEVLQRIVEHARDLCGSDFAFLALYDRETDTATVVAAAGSRSETLLSLTICRGRGIGGRVLETGEPFVTDDYLTDPRVTKDYAGAVHAEGAVAQAGVPLRLRDTITGILCVVNRTPRRFTTRDLAVLARLADQAALAVENARLFAETRTRLAETETLLAVGRALAPSVPAPEALRRVCREIARVFEADMAGIYAVETGGHALVPIAGYHVPETLRDTLTTARFPLARFPFLREAWETGKPVWTSDYGSDPRFDQDFLSPHRPRALLFAPTHARDEVMGGLFLVWWTRDRRFTSAELLLVEAATSLIGQALQRARAETELATRLRQQAAVAELGQRALTGGDLQALLDQAAHVVAQALAVEYAKVLELLPGGEALLLRAGVGWRDGLVGHATVPTTLESQAGYTLTSEAPVIVEDLRAEPRFSGPPLLHEHGVRSGLSVVIGSLSRPFGVLGAHTTRHRAFTEDDVSFLQGVANLLAAAIERTRAEEALWQSEARFRSTFDDSRLGRTLDTLDGRFFRVNRALCDLVGYSEPELLATGWQALTHPEDIQAALDLDARLLAGEIDSYLHEKRYRLKDGRVIWASVSVSLLRDPAGVPMYFLAEIEDITGRREAEARIRFQASLLDQVKNAAVATDLTGRIVYWNRHAETLYQWTADEVLGRDILQVMVPPGARRVADEIRAAIGTTGHWEGEFVVQRKDGTTFPVYAVDTLIRDPQGNPAGLIGISVDISERRRAEAAQRQHVKRLRILRDIDQAILAARSPESIADAALAHLRQLVPYWGANVVSFDVRAWEACVLAGDGHGGDLCRPGTRVSLDFLTLEDMDALWQMPVRAVRDVEALSRPVPALRALRLEGLRAYVSIALRAGDRLVGALSLGSDRPDAFGAEDVEIAREVGEVLAVALEQARLHEQIRGAHAQLEALAHRLVAVQEQERRHIARELHDEIGQLLTGLKLTLEMLPRTPSEAIPLRLGDSLALLNDLIARVRELSLDLRPAMLDDLGLLPALLWHLERYTSQTGVRVELEHAGLNRRLPSDVETAAYRIVQEALTNVARHAGVGTARLRARVGDDALHLEVEDRGDGFDAAATGPSSGLTGMRERAGLLGGLLTVESVPGAGTRVTAELPVPPAPEERGADDDHHRAG